MALARSLRKATRRHATQPFHRAHVSGAVIDAIHTSFPDQTIAPTQRRITAARIRSVPTSTPPHVTHPSPPHPAPIAPVSMLVVLPNKVVSLGYTRGKPRLHLRQQPRHAVGTYPYAARELTVLFQSQNVLAGVGHNLSEFRLGDQPTQHWRPGEAPRDTMRCSRFCSIAGGRIPMNGFGICYWRQRFWVALQPAFGPDGHLEQSWGSTQSMCADEQYAIVT